MMRKINKPGSQNANKALSNLNGLLSNSEKNNYYSKEQIEAFVILRDSFRERMDDKNTMPSKLHV